MVTDNLMNLEDSLLDDLISETKSNLFKLYERLDIQTLRLGVMCLSIHDKYYKEQVLALDDILLSLYHQKNDLSVYCIEKSRRNRLEVKK